MLSYSLERRKGFENYKNVNFENKKYGYLIAKGVKPWFRSKNPEFLLVLFSANKAQK